MPSQTEQNVLVAKGLVTKATNFCGGSIEMRSEAAEARFKLGKLPRRKTQG
jgi:hypothetical protein